MSRSLNLRPVKIAPTTNEYYWANWVPMSSADILRLLSPEERGRTDMLYILINERFVMTARIHPSIQDGYVGLTDPQRGWMGITLAPTEVVNIRPFDAYEAQTGMLKRLTFELDFASKNRRTDQLFDQDSLADVVNKTFVRQIFAPKQPVIVEQQGVPLRLTAQSVEITSWQAQQEKPDQDVPSSDNPNSRGYLYEGTQVDFVKAGGSDIKLKTSARRPVMNSIIAPSFDFNQLGIGGLDQEFQTIFRRAFASRLFPLHVVEHMDGQHVRGMLLYGPPGTGKTLIARKIGQVLNARPPKIINGPEVLNKYVGQSEENIRKLFADAEKEYKEKGDESGLHIIIFDELDAVCRQRGGQATAGSGVGDNIVNQLLAKLDGVEQLNNVLLIGMTNRRDLIDDALLRPGRLEVQIEISLPDEEGRLQIFKIQTSKTRMSKDVDLASLAARTNNYTGAEIQGVCTSARSFTYQRYIVGGTLAKVKDDLTDMQVTMNDFERALGEVKPMHGRDDEGLRRSLDFGIIHFSPDFTEEIGKTQYSTGYVTSNAKRDIETLLIHGPPGSGKTAMAAHIAQNSGMPLVKIISQYKTAGFADSMRIQFIDQAFSEAYKSKQSVVILDDLERLFSWSYVGPRFSNALVDTLIAMIGRRPPIGKKILIVATATDTKVLDDLGFGAVFRKTLTTRNLRAPEEIEIVLEEAGHVSKSDAKNAVKAAIQDAQSQIRGREVVIDIGVKNLLRVIDMAAVMGGEDWLQKFALTLADELVEDMRKKPAVSKVVRNQEELAY